MPNDVKAVVSLIVVIVAITLAYWSGSPIRPQFATFLLGTAAFMVVAMWIFAEAGGKKRVSGPRRRGDRIVAFCCDALCR